LAEAEVTPNGFAGSIFELEPGTEYDARFVLRDSDGKLTKAFSSLLADSHQTIGGWPGIRRDLLEQ
jgi:hypothetical protein